MNSVKYRFFCFAALIILGFAGFTSSAAQSANRTIAYSIFPGEQNDSIEKAINPSGLKNVLELVDVKVAGRIVTIGQPFSADEDWLKSLVFRMKNASGQSIIGARMSFGLPETHKGDKVLGFSLEYGKGFSTGIASDEQKIIKPDEEFELKFNEAQYERHKKFLSGNTDLSNFSKILIGVTMAKLEDNSVWGTRCLRAASAKNSCQ